MDGQIASKEFGAVTITQYMYMYLQQKIVHKQALW